MTRTKKPKVFPRGVFYVGLEDDGSFAIVNNSDEHGEVQTMDVYTNRADAEARHDGIAEVELAVRDTWARVWTRMLLALIACTIALTAQTVPVVGGATLAGIVATQPPSQSLGGGCAGRWAMTSVVGLLVDPTGTRLDYWMDDEFESLVLVFDVIDRPSWFYPTPFRLSVFGAHPTCVLLVQWCSVVVVPGPLSWHCGSMPIPFGWHGKLKVQALIGDSGARGGFYMSDVSQVIL